VIALGTLAWVYWMQGDYLRSREIYRESLVLAREIGLRSIEGRVIDGLGTVATALGDYAGARLLHEQALAIFRAIGDRQCESEGLSNIALILHAEGDPSAAELAARAAQLAHESGARRYESRALVILGHALTSLGRLDEAAAAYAQSLALRLALGQLYLALEPQAGLAQVALARGKIASALAHVETILADLDQIVGRGWAEPYWVIAVCIRVLRAAGDLQAEDMLHRARTKLLAHAQSLRDEELRRAFLENIATHRELLADWQNMSAPTRATWRRSPRS
jgi:tetratricopeptide (TPR) repeat protein